MQSREARYRRGEPSPEGYYRDSVDDGALIAALSRAAGPVVVLDGIFLQRRAVRARLTLVVYLRVSPEESLRRALVRDSGVLGSPSEVEVFDTATICTAGMPPPPLGCVHPGTGDAQRRDSETLRSARKIRVIIGEWLRDTPQRPAIRR